MEQGEQPVRIIAFANDSYRKGPSLGHVDWNEVEGAARQILTPGQFRLFTTMEPPLPHGGRFQSEFYVWAQAASETETKMAGQK